MESSWWLGIIGALVVGVILLILEYRSPWFARLRESLRSKRDSASKAVNSTAEAPGKSASASIQEVTIIQVEDNLVIRQPPRVTEAQSAQEVTIIQVEDNSVIRQPPRVTEAQSAGAPTEREYRTHPTPNEIAQEIKGRPLFQREFAAKCYIGLKVDWTLRFLNISRTATEGVYSVLADELAALPEIVMFQVDISKYPEFKILEKDHRLRVVGEISKVETIAGWVFTLSNCVVKVE